MKKQLFSIFLVILSISMLLGNKITVFAEDVNELNNIEYSFPDEGLIDGKYARQWYEIEINLQDGYTGRDFSLEMFEEYGFDEYFYREALNPNCFILEFKENNRAKLIEAAHKIKYAGIKKILLMPTLILDSVILGDMDRNNIITISDATFLQKEISNNTDSREIYYLADFNGDGVVNIADVTAIQINISK